MRSRCWVIVRRVQHRHTTYSSVLRSKHLFYIWKSLKFSNCLRPKISVLVHGGNLAFLRFCYKLYISVPLCLRLDNLRYVARLLWTPYRVLHLLLRLIKIKIKIKVIKLLTLLCSRFKSKMLKKRQTRQTSNNWVKEFRRNVPKIDPSPDQRYLSLNRQTKMSNSSKSSQS